MAWQSVARPSCANCRANPRSWGAKIIGGDADVDDLIPATCVTPHDIEAEAIASRAKSVAHAYLNRFCTQFDRAPLD